MDNYTTGYAYTNNLAAEGQRRLYQMLKPKKGGLIVGAIFAILTLSMVIAYVITGRSAMPNPVFFDPTSGDTDYAYIDMQLLTECFAYSEEDGKIVDCFYFVLDTNGNPSIVLLSDEQFASHQAIVDFTYSDALIGPDPVRITGIPRTTDVDLMALAVESFNEIWQYEYVTEDTAKEYFGVTFLDCTSDAIREAQSNILVFAFLFFVLSCTILVVSISTFRYQTKALRSLPTLDEAGDVYEQIARPTCQSYPAAKCFLTDDYAIGVTDALQIVPTAEIKRIYTSQFQRGRNRQTILIVEGSETIALVQLPTSRKNQQLIDQIVSALFAKAPTAQFGASENT